jgi:hypothetical protein
MGHAMGKRKVRSLTDLGYFNAREIKACNDAGIAALVLKSLTSSAKAYGRFDRGNFIYFAKNRSVSMSSSAMGELRVSLR